MKFLQILVFSFAKIQGGAKERQGEFSPWGVIKNTFVL
jgi:hypothetical protein